MDSITSLARAKLGTKSQFAVVLYLSLAVIYTTTRLPLPSFPSLDLISRACRSPSEVQTSSWLRMLLCPSSTDLYLDSAQKLLDSDIASSEPILTWPTYLDWGSAWNTRARTPESAFVAKAYTQAMKPTRIVPFYYRAALQPEADDVTITTLVTQNRLPVLTRLVEQYEGPVSVTIHANNNSTEVAALLDALHTAYAASPALHAYLDVHLVIDPFDRQFNLWRNVARAHARTRFVMLLDVDFAICTDIRDAVRNAGGAVKELMEMESGGAALVVPAFEYVKKGEGVDARSFPTNKKTLLELVREKRIEMFHASWALGHNSTDYERFYATAPGEVYKIPEYQHAYEPYIIFKRDGPPWCDERFVGYGGNKAACLFEMYISGMSFYVLSDHFLIHQDHPYEEATRKSERKFNRQIYADFKKETCLRYLKWYIKTGVLNTTVGYNVQEECKRIKGVSRVAAQLIDDVQP